MADIPSLLSLFLNAKESLVISHFPAVSQPLQESQNLALKTLKTSPVAFLHAHAKPLPHTQALRELS